MFTSGPSVNSFEQTRVAHTTRSANLSGCNGLNEAAETWCAQDVDQLYMAGHYLLGLLVHEVVEDTVPGRHPPAQHTDRQRF
jgi:hypothetical protein